MNQITYNMINGYMGWVAQGAANEAKLFAVEGYIKSRLKENYVCNDIKALAAMLDIEPEEDER